MIKRIVIAVLAMFGFYMCTFNTSSKIKDITSKSNESSIFVDLTLEIVDVQETDSNYIYTAEGLFKKDTVGIEISLSKIVASQDSEKYPKGISIRTIGTKSDKLLRAMAKLYGTNFTPAPFRKDNIELPCTDLSNGKINFEEGSHLFKVKLDKGNKAPELYINFDFSKKQISLNEKDVEYRSGVITCLMNKSEFKDKRTALNAK